ncbi:MAG: AAA family ATPase [Anaerovibrio sp.]|uniref:AAA family ATPase n=1 Tax=Anaerovibrio sp. TaxID=1872532 RepID=UPI0026383019|nr:AAA family ATPase [Anaerovibrio sp.]MDD7677505.1 AAA family ATPase [Anaerovibrio sp.]MDY2603426.1 AAA family ATPase [Anaerovibrio sp.]
MSEENISGVVITFFSTASSVGKTLISVNMASELARQGYRVCLVDYDLQFGDVANYLHIQVERSVKDVLETMNSRPDVPLQDCLTQYRYGMISFDVVPAPEFLDEAYNISADDCRRLIEKLRLLYDYVIIDTTSMFSVLNLAMLDLSTIVTFLGVVDFIPTIKNMKIGNDTLRTLNYDTNKIRLVLNRSDAKTRISMEDVERLLGGEFYHILPNDFKAASESIVTGVPLVLGGSDSVLATEIRKLISRYTNRAYEEDAGLSAFDDEEETGRRKSRGWFSKLFS